MEFFESSLMSMPPYLKIPRLPSMKVMALFPIMTPSKPFSISPEARPSLLSGGLLYRQVIRNRSRANPAEEYSERGQTFNCCRLNLLSFHRRGVMP